MAISGVSTVASVACLYAAPAVNAVARQMTIEKVGTFALGTLGILALDNMQGAEAGPVSEVACIAACHLAALTPWGLPLLPTCIQACTLLGVAPIP